MGVITIGTKDWVKGVSTSDDIPDGGFSPAVKGQNLLSNLGTMNQGTALTTIDANVVHEIYAASDDELGTTAVNLLYFVGRDSAAATTGKFYKWDAIANEPTVALTDTSGGTRTYSSSISQMEYYNNEIFVTSSVDVTRMTSGMAAFDSTQASWWVTTESKTALNTGVAHPMIKFDKKLWIADKYSLHSWDGTTAVEDVLDLTAKESGVIMALAKDPTTGNMLIATSPNTSDVTNHIGKIYSWDGFSPVPNTVATIRGYITALFVVNSTVYVFYDDMVGFWNGSGVTPLRKLDIDRSTADYIFRSRVTSVGDTLLITEQNSILAYGPIISGGKKVWHYPYTATNNIGLIHNISSNKVALADINTTSTVFGHIDLDTSVATTSTKVRTNKYYLPSNSRIKKVEVLTNALVSPGALTVQLRKSSTPTTDTTLGTFNTATSAQHTFDAYNAQTASVQLTITLNGQNDDIQLKQVKIYYEPVEKQV